MENYYDSRRIEEYKIMKLVDDIHEIMDYIDDGYHNLDIANLVHISNELLAKLPER